MSRMAKPPTALSITLDDQTSRRLTELARRSGKSVQEIAVDAIREHLKHTDPSLGTDKAVPPPKGG
jgi:predicted transcriptional regulator